MSKALICVDVQKDFLPGGALGVAEGHQTIPVLEKLINSVDVIVLTRDWHPDDHISFSNDPEYRDGSWPAHCVRYSSGSDFDPDLYHAAVDSGKPLFVINKGYNADREAYSGFDGVVARSVNSPKEITGVTLPTLLSLMNVSDVFVGGLALDYCVRATALDAQSWEFATTVVLDATRPVSYLTGAAAVADLVKAGVAIDGTEHGR